MDHTDWFSPAFLMKPWSARVVWQISHRKHWGCQLLWRALITRPRNQSIEIIQLQGSHTHTSHCCCYDLTYQWWIGHICHNKGQRASESRVHSISVLRIRRKWHPCWTDGNIERTQSIVDAKPLLLWRWQKPKQSNVRIMCQAIVSSKWASKDSLINGIINQIICAHLNWQSFPFLQNPRRSENKTLPPSDSIAWLRHLFLLLPRPDDFKRSNQQSQQSIMGLGTD